MKRFSFVCLLACAAALAAAVHTALPVCAAAAPISVLEPSPAPEAGAAPAPGAAAEPGDTPQASPCPGPETTPEAGPMAEPPAKSSAAPEESPCTETSPMAETGPLPEESPVPEASPAPEASQDPEASPAPDTGAAPLPSPASALSNAPAVVLPGAQEGTWFYGGPYSYYRCSPHRLTRGTASRLHLLMRPGREQSSFVPQPQQDWQHRGANYTVTYGAAWERELPEGGSLQAYTAVPARQCGAFTAGQVRRLEAILTHSYPYVPAAQMAGELAAAFPEADACTPQELIAGVQAALYQVLHPVADLDGDGRPEASMEWGYESTDAAAARSLTVDAAAARSVNAVRDYLLALAGQADEAVPADAIYDLASWEVRYSAPADGCRAVISGELNLPVRDDCDPDTGAQDYVALTFSALNPATGRAEELAACTLHAGEQSFRCVVENARPQQSLLAEGHYLMNDYPELYYYESAAGGQPQLGIQYTSQSGDFSDMLAPQGCTGTVSVSQDWVVGEHSFPSHHSAENWRRFKAAVLAAYGIPLPDTLTVTLLADGTPVSAPGLANPVVLSGESGWAYTWEGLPLYDANGVSIAYSLVQSGPGAGFSSGVYSYPVAAGGAQAAFSLYMMVYNYYTPYIPRIRVPVEKAWAGGGAGRDAVALRLMADGTDTGHRLALRAANGWRGAFTGLPLFHLEIDYGNLLEKADGGLAPAVRQHCFAYTVQEDAPPGYTAAYAPLYEETPCAPEAFSGDVPQLVCLAAGAEGRRLALLPQAGSGHLQLVCASPDLGDPLQQWVAWKGHLYNVYALQNGAQASYSDMGSLLVGELYLDADGARFAAPMPLGSAGPLAYRGGHLHGADGACLGQDAQGALCAVQGEAAALPVEALVLAPGVRVENRPVATPVPSPTPSPAPTAAPTRTPAPSARPTHTPAPTRSPRPTQPPTAGPSVSPTPSPGLTPSARPEPSPSMPPADGPAPLPLPPPYRTPTLPEPSPFLPARGGRLPAPHRLALARTPAAGRADLAALPTPPSGRPAAAVPPTPTPAPVVLDALPPTGDARLFLPWAALLAASLLGLFLAWRLYHS